MENEEIFQKIEHKLLEQNGLSLSDAELMLGSLQGPEVDFSDVYFEHIIADGWSLSEGIVKSGNFYIASGFGVRSVSNEKTAFAFSDSINFPNLKETFYATKKIAKLNHDGNVKIGSPLDYKQVCRDINPVAQLSKERKTQILKEMDEFVRGLDSRVTQVSVVISSSYRQRLIVGTDNTYAADIMPQAIIRCTVQVSDNGKVEMGSDAFGIADGFDCMDELVPILDDSYLEGITDIALINSFEKRYLSIARGALRTALRKLKARSMTAGKMPIVLASGWPAVLIHEAVGHGLEADAIRKGASIFKDSIGKQVASDLCTIVDDGTIYGRLGSKSFDSEGTKSQSNVLIKDGVLCGYMCDKLNAKLLNMKPTGNGRRAGYSYIPIPRMTNTYLMAGKDNPQDIISSLDRGVYAVNFSGGQVDTASGNFTFTASEAYYVENGKIQYPVKDITLIGNGQETLKKVTMVGNDLSFDKGIGSCGKEGQFVQVGIGQPTVRVEDVTVGGTK